MGTALRSSGISSTRVSGPKPTPLICMVKAPRLLSSVARAIWLGVTCAMRGFGNISTKMLAAYLS